MNRETAKGLSQELRDALDPLLVEIESLNERIAGYDRRIEQIAQEVYPECALLQQVKGVGTVIALTYILTLDDAHRFRRSRDAGCFLGLRPGRGSIERNWNRRAEPPSSGDCGPSPGSTFRHKLESEGRSSGSSTC
jgi:transposase